jgi:hypothetical protein
VNDDELRRLLADAVSDVEPTERIDELRASVRPSPVVVPMSGSRTWYAAAGIVATASVIGTIAYLSSVAGHQPPELGPTSVATDPAAPQLPTGKHPGQTLAVYYPGHSRRGEVLYRQATPVSTALDPLAAAVSRLMTQPYDPDYRLGWSPGWLTSARESADVIWVDVGSAPESRPAGMSARRAYVTVQSAVYTLQAAAHSSARVLFARGGVAADTVLGVPTRQPVGPGKPSDVLSRMDITRPVVDGQHPHRGQLVVTGLADQPLGGVVVHLVRTTQAGLRETVRSDTGLSAAVADGTGRFPWRVLLDTRGLRAGTYTVVARNDGPRAAADTDTRVVLVR